ncbi:MAG TPA: prepilin-type N-terminal cleavage/methylation domain-containing protein [Sedimentisphaerales bacterium]|nr:prepilin-type N-terminal cleavage/methylation domain-containing protein [Sedimentisphaerales bacterium]
MMWCSKKNPSPASRRSAGFTLPEVMAALTILAFVSASVVVVISRCMASAADTALRMQALEVARDNMEKLLATDALESKTEYGSSEKYPEIQWQTVVEPFYEPVTSRMWVQATCSAEYTDVEDETQKVELTHWLTNLTKQEVQRLLEEEAKAQEQLAEQVLETIQEAAEYAGVDEQTIQQWVQNGMPRTKEGYYIMPYIALYQEYDGNPPPEARTEVAQAFGPLTLGSRGTGPQPGGPAGPGASAGPEGPAGPGGPSPTGQENPWKDVPQDMRNDPFWFKILTELLGPPPE